MQVAVCDDNKLCLTQLYEKLISTNLTTSVSPFSSLETFLFSVEDGCFYNAVFMDIDWSQKAMGIDAAKELYRLSPETKIIYVTGYGEEYSQNIFLHNANLSGFLTKPVDEELLKANLKKVAALSNLPKQPTIALRQGNISISVPFHDIFFIESKGRTIEMHTQTETFISIEKLGNFLNRLPICFIQCHKSYIVNMAQIQRFYPNEILLKNEARVPVSRSRYSKTKEAYFSYIGGTF